VAEAGYLYEVIATNQFQAGLRNYRDLVMLEQHLAGWQGRLASFGDIVESRREAYAAALQRLPEDLYVDEVLAQQDRYRQLSDELAFAISNNNAEALADANQLRIAKRIAVIEQSAAFKTANPAAQEKLRVLKGLLTWDLERDYKYRAWRQQRSLDDLSEVIAASQTEHVRFVGQLTAIPAELDDYDIRAQGLAPRVENLLLVAADLAGAQIAELGEIAAAELVERRDRVLQYRAQAQFAEAAIYDSSRASTESAP
jgi:hypothetical protein